MQPNDGLNQKPAMRQQQQTLTFDSPLTATDQPRLSRQLAAVLSVMSDRQWHTLESIQRGIGGMGCPATTQGVSARLRDLRKAEHGSHMIERRRTATPGIFEYRQGTE